MQTLLFERSGHRADITLNQPRRKNALSQAMWGALAEAVGKVANDPSIRVLVIRGAEGAFSAGADISEFERVYATPEAALAANANIAVGLDALDNLTTPSIAAIAGPCMGGGCALALACDLQVADRTAVFGINPTALGTAYSFRDCQRLVSRIGINRAKRLLIGAAQIDADTAEIWGLVTEVAQDRELATVVDELAASLAARSPQALAATNQLLGAIDFGTGGESPELRQLFQSSFHSHDFIEGTTAFLEKRPPDFGKQE